MVRVIQDILEQKQAEVTFQQRPNHCGPDIWLHIQVELLHL